MSNTVDERIVEAKFDASDFEKGVDKTVKKLDELKKSLNLKETGKSVTEFTKEASEGIEKSNKALDRLSERLTTFKGMIKQKILGGLADEISGVFLGLERSITGFVKSLSSDQMRAGMDKYTEILNSVRTMTAAGIEESTAYEQIKRLAEYSDQTSYSLNQMTSGMSKLVAAGMKVDKAEKSMEGLANMCASAGVNIYDAQRAFLNFAQAYSSGTMKLNDWMSFESLNMATENVMKVFMEAGEQVGTLTKTIKKDGTEVYKTVNKVNKQVKAGKEVTTKGYRDTLNYGWLDNKTMEQATAVLSYFEDIGVEVDKLSDDQLKTFAARAFQAAKEARSFADVMGTIKDVVATGWATSFEMIFGKLEEATKFFTWLSESNLAQAIYKIGEFRNTVLKTWGEAYAGEDEEGNLVGGVFVKGKTGRDMLMEALKNIDELVGHVSDGLEGMAKYEYNGVIKHLLNFPETLGKNLGYLTKGFRDATRGMLEFFTTTETVTYGNQTETRRKLKDEFLEPIQKISDAIGASFSIISKLGTKAAATFGTVMEKLTPVFLAIGNAVGTMLSPIVDLDQNGGFFDSIQNIIDNILTIAQPVLNVLPDIIKFLGEVGTFFTGMAIDTITMNAQFLADSLGLVMEIFGIDSAQKLKDGEGVLGGIRQEFEGIKEACESGINAVKDFMGSLIGDLRELFGLTEPVEGEEGGVFSRLTNFFETNEFLANAKAWIDQAIVDVTSWIKDIPNKIKNLGASIYDTLYNLFFTEVTIGSAANKETVLTPLGEWLNQAIIDIKAWFADLPNKIITGVGAVTNWINEVLDAWFGKKNTKEVSKSKHIQDEYNPIAEDGALTSKFDDILLSVKNSIVEWFTDLPNKINTAFSEVGNFASNLWDVIDDFLFGKKTSEAAGGSKNIQDERGAVAKEIVYREKGVLQNIIDNIVTGVTTFIRNIPEHIKSAIKGTGDIITTILNTLLGKKPDDKEPAAETVGSKLQEALKNFSLSGVLDTIKDIGKTILNQIIRIFTGSEDFEVNTEWLSGKVAEGIEYIKTKAGEAWDVVKAFLVSIPSMIAGIFNGEGQQSQTSEQSPIQKALIDFGNTVGGFIADIPTTISTFVTNAINEIDKLWQNFYNKVTDSAKGEAEAPEKEISKRIEDDVNPEAKIVEGRSKWDEFVASFGETIKTAIEKLPTWVAQGVDLAIKAINEEIQKLTDWIAGLNPEKEIADASASAKDAAVAGAESAAEAGVSEIGIKSGAAAQGAEKKAESPFKTALNSIGLTLRNLITQTIPKLLKEGWDLAVAKASDLGNTLTHLFDNYEGSDFEQTVNTLGEKIRTALLELPGKIAGAFEFIAKLVKSLLSGGDVLGVEEGMSEAEKTAIEAVKEKKEEIAEELGKEGESVTFFDQLGESLLNAFKQIGPTVLNGLSSAFDWLSTIGENITKILTGKVKLGDLFQDTFGEDNPELVDGLLRFGDSIKTFFTSTLPDLIGASIGALLVNSHEWFAKLFEGLNKSMKKEEENSEQKSGEKAIDPLQSAIDFVSNFINMITSKLGGNEVVTALACIVAVTSLIGAIRSLFDIGVDIAEAEEDTVKWAVIALAISAIASIFSFVDKIADEGNPDKMQFALDILDKLGNLAEKIMWVMGLFAASKAFTAIGDIFGGGDDEIQGPLGFLVNGFSDAINSIITSFGGAVGFTIAGEAALGVAEDATDTIGEMFASIGDAANELIEEIAPFINTLTDLNDDLDLAIGSIGKLSTLFSDLYNIFGDLYYSVMGHEKKEYGEAITNAVANVTKEVTGLNTDADTRKGLEEFTADLESKIDIFIKMSAFLDTLASAVDKLQDIDDIGIQIDKVLPIMNEGGKLEQFMTSMFNILDSYFLGSRWSNYNFGSFFDVDTYNSIAMGLQLISSALSVFGEGISGFSEENVDYLSKTLDVFNNLALAFSGSNVDIGKSGLLAKFTGDNGLSALGKEIKSFGSRLKFFMDDVVTMKGFGEDEAETTQTKLKAIADIALALGTVAARLNSSGDILSGGVSNNFGGFVEGLEEYGGRLVTAATTMINSMDTNVPVEKLTTVETIIGIIANIGNMIANLANAEYKDTGWFGNESPFDVFNRFVESLNNLSSVENNPFSKAIESISGFVNDNLNISPTITPVVDMTDVEEKAVRLAELGLGPGNHEITFDTTNLNNNANSANPDNFIIPQPIDYTAYLAAIQANTASINSLLPLSSGGGQVVLNTGQLVGALVDPIAQRLGRSQYEEARR